MPESPLAEADPRSLDELYAADPLSLTDKDVNKIVADLQEKRKLWLRAEAEAGAQGQKRVKKVYKEAPEPGQLSLDGLGLTGTVMPGKD